MTMRSTETPASPMRKPRRKMTGALALAGLLLAATAPPASAEELGPTIRISGASPFTRCTADQAGAQPGTLYRQSEVEPRGEANPARPRNIIAVWQQDRWSNGGARGNAAAFSNDGGVTWRTRVPPRVTRCTGGPFARASDPWISISPDGTAYFMSLVFQNDLPDGRFGANAMVVNRSLNGGHSWSNPITLRFDRAGQVLNDKNALTADPTDSRFAYAVWDRLTDFALPANAHGGGARGARARARLIQQQAAGQRATQPIFKGPAVITRTTNGGRTWEPIKVIHDPGNNAQTINNIVVVPPSGAVIDFFTEISGNGGNRIGLKRSFDKGRTFEAQPTYATVIDTVFGVVTPDSLFLVRDASVLFDVTVDSRSGRLYLVWQDTRFDGIDRIAFSESRDGGDTWSAPVPINRTPVNRRNRLRQQAFLPTVKVGPGGKIVVTYYDFRADNDNRPHELTDHWAALCDPRTVDCRRAASWGVELRLTPRSFDYLRAPDANGLFLGDYMGAVTSGTTVLPIFGIADGVNQASIFTRAIDLGAGSVVAAKP